MTPPSPRTLALFTEALDHGTAEREAWLAQSCPDTGVRREVAAMLATLTTEGMLDRPLLDRARDAPEADDPRIGQRIGVWRVTGLLGRGGMGSVYRAARDDGAYAQQAAIKLGHPGMRPDLGARFLAERAVLADLDHPGIARLLDGGVAPDGAPFLAMELVEGEPITAYAKTHALDTRQRLALFVQACEAVAYAHRNLVVHRDLKPDHIRVEDGGPRTEERGPGAGMPEAGAGTPSVADTPHPSPSRIPHPSAPRVTLLDFGVAKLLAPEADVHTRTGLGPLTPAYAAPEQFLGRAITTATDVYALGVVLYELLTGQRPYEVAGLTAAQAERVVCETAPARHPTRPASGTARVGLRGDLGTICLKALEKEPGRRYASAEALADDIRRYLDGLPVLARPSTPGYRLSRFVRRHRLGVAASAAVLGLAIATVAFYTVRLRAERDRAEAASAEAIEETERAEAVAGFLEQILRAPNTRWYNDAEATGPETPIRAVLDEAARRVDRDFAAQPDLRADLHHLLGDTYAVLGLSAEGRRHHRRTLALRESLYTPPDPRIAEALYYVAVNLPDSSARERMRLFEQAVAMQRARNEGNNFPFMTADLAGLYLNQGRAAEAVALAAEGLAFVQARFVPGDDGHRYRDVILVVLAQRRTRALQHLGDLTEAAREIAFTDSLLARLPRTPAHHMFWRDQMCTTGSQLRRRGRFAEAEPPLLACYGLGPPRAPASPFPRSEPQGPEGLEQQRLGSVELVSLYEAWGRPAQAAPFRAQAARVRARQDSIRVALRPLATAHAR